MKCFNCKRCATCCRTLTIEVTASDLRRWFTENRIDILEEIGYLPTPDSKRSKGGFYFEKTLMRKDGTKLQCPFLNDENLCSIYDTRPRICRDYPEGFNGYKSCPNLDHVPNEKKATKIKKLQINDFSTTYREQGYYFKKLVEARDSSG